MTDPKDQGEPEIVSGKITPPKLEPSWWGIVPLALVVLALLGSVAIPARQTWLITDVIKETTEVLAPARGLQARLQSGLASELRALQSYALYGDSSLLSRYRSSADSATRRVDGLERLAPRLGAPSAERVDSVRMQIADWHHAIDSLLDRPHSRSEFAASLKVAQGDYDAALSSLAVLSADLVSQTRSRDERVRQLEHFSLVSNVVLVLAAFAALVGVVILAVRERRALVNARRRERQEAALRGAAEELAGAFTSDDVTQVIAHAALEALQGRGAFVEEISVSQHEGDRVVAVRATAGSGVPALGSTCELAGSYTEHVTAAGESILIADGETGDHSSGTRVDRPPSPASTLPTGYGTAIVLPLGSRGIPVGALFVVSPDGSSFRGEDIARASIIGHLAALAYEKVRLLEEAYEARRKLERVIKSRSRLIRGFSHDVKNPIGAADGYAALLIDGILGELSGEQLESIKRIRRGIRNALSLIDDLHELGRAETGHLSLPSDQVDVGDLMRVIGEEYQAAASAAGLTLNVDVAPDLPLIVTSLTRVRQIASNLLSNAIKYTETGSVTVRVVRRVGGPIERKAGHLAENDSEWILIEFIDTGRGIPPDRREFIFEEFSRIGDSSKPGAGLGLAISRLLAEALGGRISLESELGKGSTFTLWLPVHSPASAID